MALLNRFAKGTFIDCDFIGNEAWGGEESDDDGAAGYYHNSDGGAGSDSAYGRKHPFARHHYYYNVFRCFTSTKSCLLNASHQMIE